MILPGSRVREQELLSVSTPMWMHILIIILLPGWMRISLVSISGICRQIPLIDTKLILIQPGSNIMMSMCIHIGVDTESNSCSLTLLPGKIIYNFQFLNRFYIETINRIFKSLDD